MFFQDLIEDDVKYRRLQSCISPVLALALVYLYTSLSVNQSAAQIHSSIRE
jgi:hypothetical protein